MVKAFKHLGETRITKEFSDVAWKLLGGNTNGWREETGATAPVVIPDPPEVKLPTKLVKVDEVKEVILKKVETEATAPVVFDPNANPSAPKGKPGPKAKS